MVLEKKKRKGIDYFMQTKYNASKVELDGHKFDSKLEANIYKRIRELNLPYTLQPSFELQEKFKFGKHTIRPISYIADFMVIIDGTQYIIDAKGMETRVFMLKRKLFMYKYGKDIVCIKSVKQFNAWYEGVKNATSTSD